jgi:hypothetical protein
MSGTRGGIGRVLAMGIALALALLLVVAGEARAGKYAVAQCGWYVGADAEWADTTGGAKFRADAYCVPPAGADPFDGAHLKSLTRDGQATLSGTRFARWRWVAPAGTGITQVHGTWWQALHDGIEQRLGTDPGGGRFAVFGVATETDLAPRQFAFGFATPQAAFEDRLLCAKAETKWCSLDAPSWSALRALTIVLEDPSRAITGIGGDLLAGGWRRGAQSLVVAGADSGSGLSLGETLVDGARVGLTEFACARVLIGGEWRGTAMRPCALEAAATHTVATATFSDGPHAAVSCVTDFAGNHGCTVPQPFLVDNNPPAHPRAVALAGGEGWRRTNDFDLSWTDPDQGPASPIAGAGWRVTGPAGYDSGARFAAGRDLAALANLSVPAAGTYSLAIWLRDEAGNEAPAAGVTVPLRFDDVPPRVAFAGGAEEVVSERILATVEDPLSGPASGQILYRRADSERWQELPTKLLAAATPGQTSLVAPMPELAPGTYPFRVDAADGAGNTASSTLRADGTRMEIHVAAPAVVTKTKTRLFARLRGGKGGGRGTGNGGAAATVPFGAAALVSGRLTRADGAGLAGRELRIVTRPSRGALLPAATVTVRTGERGGFELRLAPGPSRQVSVAFDGDAGLDPTSRRSLDLRVRSGVTLTAEPRALDNGETVTLSGGVGDRAAPIPRRGKLIAVQYQEEETGRWRPVLVTRSDHDGRFRARYRFRYVSTATSIRLRATALAEERWPYAPGSSAPVTVHVGG